MPQSATPTQRTGKPITRFFRANRQNVENQSTQVPLAPHQAFFSQSPKLIYPLSSGDGTYVPNAESTGRQRPAYNRARTARAKANNYAFQDNNKSFRASSPTAQHRGFVTGIDHLFGWHRADAAIGIMANRKNLLAGSPAQTPSYDATTVGAMAWAGAGSNPIPPDGPYTPAAGIWLGAGGGGQ